MNAAPVVYAVASAAAETKRQSEGAEAQARDLLHSYGHLGPRDLLETMIRRVFPGRIALVASFGAESAVLLDLVAQIDPATPVIFLNTDKLFAETLLYRDHLVARLGLTDVREVRPDPEAIATIDPAGTLWLEHPDHCCFLRKVLPLERALSGFPAWITGRKRFHGDRRRTLAAVEAVDGRIKVNPMAQWTKQDLDGYFANAPHLPRHPLEALGFLSIGCMPCTSRVAPGEGFRDGRWRNRNKTECGIHLSRSVLEGR